MYLQGGLAQMEQLGLALGGKWNLLLSLCGCEGGKGLKMRRNFLSWDVSSEWSIAGGIWGVLGVC